MNTKAIILGIATLSASYSFASEVESVHVVGKELNADNAFKTTLSIENLNHKTSVTTLENISSFVPSLGTVKAGRSSAITINGLGYNGGFHNPSIEPPIAIYIDDVYIPRHSIISTGFLDLKNIIVEEGIKSVSQPTTSGLGTLFLETKNPSFDGNEYTADLRVGTNGKRVYGLSTNLDFGNSALSVSGLKSEDDGSLNNFHTGTGYDIEDTTLINIKSLTKLDNGLHIGFSHYQNKDGNGWTSSSQTLSHNFDIGPGGTAIFNNVIPLGYGIFNLSGAPDGAIDLPDTLSKKGTSNDVDSEGEEKNSVSKVRLSKEFKSTTLSSTTSYVKSKQRNTYDADNTDYSLGSQEVSENYRALTQEFKLRYSQDKLTVDSGISYTDTKLEYNYVSHVGDDLLVLNIMGTESNQQIGYLLGVLNNGQPRGQHLSTNSNNKEESTRYGAYADVEIGDSKSPLRVGLNMSNVDKDFRKSTDGLCSFSTANLPSDQCSPTQMRGVLDPTYFRGDDSKDQWLTAAYIYKGWSIGDNAYSYATLGTSQKPGGFNSMQSLGFGPGQAQSIEALAFKKETSHTMDIGYSLGFGESSSFAVNFFGTIIKDYQLNYFTGFGFNVVGADEVKSLGAKINVDTEIVPGLQFIGTINYAKAYYSDHENALCPPSEYRTPANCNYMTLGQALSVGDTLRSDLSGSDLRAPRLTSNLTLQNSFELFGQEISHNIEYRFTGRKRTTDYDVTASEQDSFGIWNYNLSAALGSKVELLFSVNNIADKQVIIFEFPSTIVRAITDGTGLPTSTYGTNAIVNEGRRVEAGVRIKF